MHFPLTNPSKAWLYFSFRIYFLSSTFTFWCVDWGVHAKSIALYVSWGNLERKLSIIEFLPTELFPKRKNGWFAWLYLSKRKVYLSNDFEGIESRSQFTKEIVFPSLTAFFLIFYNITSSQLYHLLLEKHSS